MNGIIKLVLDTIEREGKATFSYEFLVSSFKSQFIEEGLELSILEFNKWLVQSREEFGVIYESDINNEYYTFRRI
ncbi:MULTISPECIES: hypothetical protein [Flammeovirga]|uniref:Uncharacterized protein n=1 Tax=Flammeovirga agarivorans TaxID=2726742 RepID=A0A7X8SNZ0_9BACT|nr:MULTISPECIES: hypothetical protein [Flammeovirga]NLR93607.1 hypothetical protein [Flammeovirga agarivorans]